MLFARRWRSRVPPVVAMLLLSSMVALAHEHHDTSPPDESVPIDWIIWLHIAIQSVAWFFLFPLATVFGLTRHRLHVPTAITGLLLTSAGFVMGHKHGGRRFPHTAHGSVASLLIPILFTQGFLGLYLKLHLKWWGEARTRPFVLIAHGILGKAFAVLGWLQMLLGVLTLRGWCMGGATGQCLAHHAMGSALIGYGIVLLIMMKAGVDWLKRRNMSQEMLDSTVIFCWGWVNALAEHRGGGRWSHKDLQHTMLGVVWVAGGAAGMWVSRNGKRSVFPSIIIVLTGWVMSGHAQTLNISKQIHALFGYTLTGVGIGRIVEICFLLEDHPTGSGQQEHQAVRSGQWYPIRAFQYLPIWLLFASGAILMSATNDELSWAAGQGIDHITWGLMDFTLSFIIFLWANVLIDFYISQGGRYGSRYAAAAAAAGGSAGEAVEAGQSGTALYNRLSLDDSSGEERTAVESRTNSNDSIEMERVKTKKRSAPPSYRAPSPNHVIFNQEEEEEEEEDPFEDR